MNAQKYIYCDSDKEKMIKEIERVFPGSSGGYIKYIEREKKLKKKP